MKKTIVNVFLVIGVLVLALLIWAVFFGNSLGTAWNAVAGQINTAWSTVVGGSEPVVNEWSVDGGHTQANVSDQAANAGGATIS